MLIDLKEYKHKKFERRYFEFYAYVESFFDTEMDEQSITERVYLPIRYLLGIADLVKTYKKIKKPTKAFILTMNALSKAVNRISEDLRDA